MLWPLFSMITSFALAKMIHDRDACYGSIFIRRVRSLGIRDHPTSARSPWQNGYAERLIGSIRRECLDHIVVTGERHLRHILACYMDYYNAMRTHLSLGKDAPNGRAILRHGPIEGRPMLGGVWPSCCSVNDGTGSDHGLRLGDSLTSSMRMEFSAHTATAPWPPPKIRAPRQERIIDCRNRRSIMQNWTQELVHYGCDPRTQAGWPH
jgi:hypothetical protein